MVVQLAFFVHIQVILRFFISHSFSFTADNLLTRGLKMQKFVLGKPIFIPRSLVFATAFMCFFSAVIALFKVTPQTKVAAKA